MSAQKVTRLFFRIQMLKESQNMPDLATHLLSWQQVGGRMCASLENVKHLLLNNVCQLVRHIASVV